jgi:hypothetical protein
LDIRKGVKAIFEKSKVAMNSNVAHRHPSPLERE